jgi:glutamine amidotransferase-like uncharacterized protein
MRGTIALFIAHPFCSFDCANGMIKALEHGYKFKIFGQDTVEDEFFDDVDIVAVPGGIGDANSYKRLMRANQSRIRRFVADGGGYLGICMGAYWAAKDYLDILDGVKATQYITRPDACTRRPHPKGMPIDWEGKHQSMYFYDGPAFHGNRSAEYETVATYPNGDAMAIYQGRIGLIGCHPESTPHWYRRPAYMKRHWHQGQHHKLLRKFTDRLMQR